VFEDAQPLNPLEFSPLMQKVMLRGNNTDGTTGKAIKKDAAILGVIGITNICGANYLAVIEQATKVGVLNQSDVNKVTVATFYPFT
jgi:hypothetical protein